MLILSLFRISIIISPSELYLWIAPRRGVMAHCTQTQNVVQYPTTSFATDILLIISFSSIVRMDILLFISLPSCKGCAHIFIRVVSATVMLLSRIPAVTGDRTRKGEKEGTKLSFVLLLLLRRPSDCVAADEEEEKMMIAFAGVKMQRRFVQPSSTTTSFSCLCRACSRI